MSAVDETKTATVRTVLFRDGKVVDRDFPPAQISDHLEDPRNLVWFDLDSPAAADLEVITEELGLHPLAIEDALHPHQRPKVDRYESHLFMTVYLLNSGRSSRALVPVELDAFVTKRALVTVHRGPIDFDAIEIRWRNMLTQTGTEIAVLVHGLIDAAVDGYFSIVQDVDDELDEIETVLFEGAAHNREVQLRSFQVRKDLVTLRRVVLPMREVVNTFMRRDLGFVSDDFVPYYQDIYDHVLRVTEWTESLRDLVSTLLDTNLSIQSNYLNEVMRQLTAWAAIIAVPTAITGFYGQNVPYPGFGKAWGFWTSTFAIIIISAALWSMFRKKKWL